MPHVPGYPRSFLAWGPELLEEGLGWDTWVTLVRPPPYLTPDKQRWIIIWSQLISGTKCHTGDLKEPIWVKKPTTVHPEETMVCPSLTWVSILVQFIHVLSLSDPVHVPTQILLHLLLLSQLLEITTSLCLLPLLTELSATSTKIQTFKTPQIPSAWEEVFRCLT